jgi:hypothetical protein
MICLLQEARRLNKLNARLVGIELYFDDSPQGKRFYTETLGLNLLDEDPSRYARFAAGPPLLSASNAKELNPIRRAIRPSFFSRFPTSPPPSHPSGASAS